MNGGENSVHSVSIQQQKHAELTGISEVESFHETEIDLLYVNGAIAVEGENLKIESFSVESGKISIDGKITGIFYYEKNNRSSSGRIGLFARRPKQ